MKVAIQKIYAKDFSFDYVILAKDWALSGFDVKTISKVGIKGVLSWQEGKVNRRAKVAVYRQIDCSRCLAQVCQIESYDFCHNYRPEKEEEFFEVEKGIREEILLNFPLKVLCRPDCRGLCSACGKNLNWGNCGCSAGVS